MLEKYQPTIVTELSLLTVTSATPTARSPRASSEILVPKRVMSRVPVEASGLVAAPNRSTPVGAKDLDHPRAPTSYQHLKEPSRDLKRSGAQAAARDLLTSLGNH